MKIVVFEAAPHGASVIERRKEQHDVRIVAEPLHAANVADAEVISTFIYSTLDRAVLGSQDVRFWHLADIYTGSENVRFGGIADMRPSSGCSSVRTELLQNLQCDARDGRPSQRWL